MRKRRFKVIEAKEIAELDKPEFSIGKYASETDYYNYLVQMQGLFDEYRMNGDVHRLTYSSLLDIKRNENEQRRLDNFKSDFLGLFAITVRKDRNSKYECAGNGRHRLYVAKKYELRVLVEDVSANK